LFDRSDPAWGLLRADSRAREQGFPLFTDEDPARRFLEELRGLRGYAPARIADPSSLAELTDLLARKGCTHVSSDPSRHGTRYCAVQHIATLARAAASRGGRGGP
jgi:hypothetical protein